MNFYQTISFVNNIKKQKMSGLIKSATSTMSTFVNINKEGKLYVKKKDESGNVEIETYESLCGVITKVEFIVEEFSGQNSEKAKFRIQNGGDSYILQIRTDTGYFRGLCNALKSGLPRKEVVITPSLKVDDKGKGKATCFVSQDGRYLKHYFTKDFKGKGNDILPDLEKVEFKGKIEYDNTKQLQYWKNWLTETFKNNEPIMENDIEDETDLPF